MEKQNLATSNTSLAALKAQLGCMKHKVTTVCKDLELKTTQVTEARKKVSKAEREAADAKSETAEQQRIVCKMMVVEKQLETEIERLKRMSEDTSELDGLRKQLKASEGRCRSLEEEREKLEEKLDALAAAQVGSEPACPALRHQPAAPTGPIAPTSPASPASTTSPASPASPASPTSAHPIYTDSLARSLARPIANTETFTRTHNLGRAGGLDGGPNPHA